MTEKESKEKKGDRKRKTGSGEEMKTLKESES